MAQLVNGHSNSRKKCYKYPAEGSGTSLLDSKRENVRRCPHVGQMKIWMENSEAH